MLAFLLNRAMETNVTEISSKNNIFFHESQIENVVCIVAYVSF